MDDRTDPEPRLRAMQRLAASVRALCDAAASTDLAAEEVDDVRAAIDAQTERLRSRHHDGPYSGLMRLPLDYRDPQALLPLSPIIGPMNPSAPDVELHFVDGGVVGRARLGKRHIGPPGAAHGGITAMIADQMVAVAPFAMESELGYVTHELTVRYLAPTPLYEDLVLEARCDPDEPGFPERVTTRGTIRAGDITTVVIEAKTVAAPQVTRPRERKAAPAP